PAGLLIGAGFGAALESGADLPLTLYRDPGKTIEQQILAGNLIPAFFGALGEGVGKHMGKKILATLDFPLLGRERAQAILDSSWTSMEGLVAELRAKHPDAADPESDDGSANGPSAGEKKAGDDEGFDFAS